MDGWYVAALSLRIRKRYEGYRKVCVCICNDPFYIIKEVLVNVSENLTRFVGNCLIVFGNSIGISHTIPILSVGKFVSA